MIVVKRATLVSWANDVQAECNRLHVECDVTKLVALYDLKLAVREAVGYFEQRR